METINGMDYFVSETFYGSGDDFSVIAQTYARVADDGSVLILESKESTQESVMVYRDMTVCKRWRNVAEEGKVTTMEVKQLDGKIITPAQRCVDCLVLESEEKGVVMRSYFMKNIRISSYGNDKG